MSCFKIEKNVIQVPGCRRTFFSVSRIDHLGPHENIRPTKSAAGTVVSRWSRRLLLIRQVGLGVPKIPPSPVFGRSGGPFA
jgi:hypothetical protein